MYRIQFTKEGLFDIETVVLWYEEQRIGLSYTPVPRGGEVHGVRTQVSP